jgi:hypothetical protein
VSRDPDFEYGNLPDNVVRLHRYIPDPFPADHVLQAVDGILGGSPSLRHPISISYAEELGFDHTLHHYLPFKRAFLVVILPQSFL